MEKSVNSIKGGATSDVKTFIKSFKNCLLFSVYLGPVLVELMYSAIFTGDK